MQIETLKYSIKMGGRILGEQWWQVTPEPRHWVTRVQTHFNKGFLGGGVKIQVSKIHPQSRVSAHYTETTEGEALGKGHFETVFDRKQGLVIVRQGRDEASVPMVRGFQDPISLLQSLRSLPEDFEYMCVPMVGAHVHVLPWTGPLEMGIRSYSLRPGRVTVHIETASPNRIVRLIQPLGRDFVEVSLMEPQTGTEHTQPKKKRRTRKTKP